MRSHHLKDWRVVRRSGLVLVAMLAITVPVLAQYRYLASEAIVVGATAIGFTAATINQGNGHPQAELATCTLETATIRYAIDGTTPTATVGMLWAVGATLEFSPAQVVGNFRAIRTGATSGDLSCIYATP